MALIILGNLPPSAAPRGSEGIRNIKWLTSARTSVEEAEPSPATHPIVTIVKAGEAVCQTILVAKAYQVT